MIYRLYLLLLVALPGIRTVAQKDYKWEREHPGKLVKYKSNPVPAFAVNRVFEIINQIPIVSQPRGYDVGEAATVRLSGDVYTGQLLVGFPMYYRWGQGPLQKQVEYYMTHISINDREELRDIYSHFMSEETDKLKMPPIFTDTFAVAYQEVNGCTVGMAQSRVNQDLYILNPGRRACFVPVTKEQFIKLWIGKLGLDIAKEEEVLADTRRSMNAVKDNAEATAELQQGVKRCQLLLEFYKEKKRGYEQKLASLPAAEKKASAFAATPKYPMVLQQKGKLVDKVTGDLFNELSDGIEATKLTPLYMFNPDFFNPKVPKTAFQSMVIKDGYRQGWKGSELIPLLQKDFFPLIDFKQLSALMYK